MSAQEIEAQGPPQDESRASTDGCADTGLECLLLIARLHQLGASADQLRHERAAGQTPFDTADLLRAARDIGMKAKALNPTPERLAFHALPAIATSISGRYFILAQTDGKRFLIHDPRHQRPMLLDREQFMNCWSGTLIVLTSQASLRGDLAKFDVAWFFPAIIKHRRVLGEVLIISVFVQIFALLTPLFFQVVMDKVLVHQAMTTLNVLVVGMLFVSIFESALSALRTYIFSHTTSRIDVELGSRLYRHLLGLPLAYFQARRVGDSVARVRELENIRAFLTGNAVTLALDVVFSIVFIGVMFLYSATLTLFVVASLPIYVLITRLVVPLLRSRLNEKFTRGAESQAFLVESVSNVQTIKAMALEPTMLRRWDERLAAYVQASFKSSTLAANAHEGIGFIGKLVNVGVLWYGARLVLELELTVGELVAFNMFAARVSQPIVRIAQMWADFQQVGISLDRLADILNVPTESNSQRKAGLPRIRGRVTLEQMKFRYRLDGPVVLDRIDMDIAAGEVVGIVGRSGSGKSTLAKLLQRLYVPEAGRILIDGHDLAMVDVMQLRRQVAVVLQESQLFNGTIRENISLADPAASLEAVVRAARLAGAHDFIADLPDGYDTPVGEQGATLSGGQRQRIAIARALFTDPRVLIFDEATSALDYESEAIIQRNMREICAGRTVIIIAHRLSSVRHAHRIVVLNEGRIHEVGTHEHLLARPGSVYAHLWSIQQSNAA